MPARRLTHRTGLSATLLLCTLMVYGCVAQDAGTPAAGGGSTPVAYNGPGSRWDFALNDGVFAITMRPAVDAAVAMSVGGTYERLPSGFLRLTVVSAEGAGAPAPGDQAWAVEVPGYALLLKPMSAGSDQIIPMVSAGECPAADFQANWVIVKKASSSSADDADRDFFGTFAFDAATSTATLPQRRALANAFQDGGAQALAGTTCEAGIMTVADGVMYLTANGGAIVHTGVNDPDDGSFIFALAQKAVADVANLDGDYAGVLFDESLADGTRIAPVALSCSAGTCTGNLVTNVVSGAVSGDSVTVTLDGAVDGFGSGLLTGTIADGTGSGNLACMADHDVLDSGRRMVSCVGQSPGDNRRMFNVLFVSRE